MEQNDDLLRRAASEIKHLRNRNQIMSARLDMFDNVMMLFKAEPPRNGYSESLDIVQELEKSVALNESCKSGDGAIKKSQS